LKKKEPGKFRPLRIADVRDRLVCKAISSKLDELLSKKFNLDNDASFAYRKNRGVYEATKTIVDHYNNGYKIILEADIKKFFDTVDRDLLLEKVFKELPDDSLNNLIKEGLSQEVDNMDKFGINAHYFENSVGGIPQGNALSPLFANIYLSEFDSEILKHGYKLVRYADDFVILTKTHDEAKQAYLIAKKFLEEKLKLEIHELGPKDSKTRILSPSQESFSFLSIRFDGKRLWVDKSNITRLKTKIQDVTDMSNDFNLIKVLTKTRNMIEGWLASFKFVDVEKDIEEIDDHIDVQLYIVFRKFDFNIKSKFVRTVTTSKGTAAGLTQNQRRRTGVQHCQTFLNSLERQKIIE
jgi:RNA-directed DNA polymerase